MRRLPNMRRRWWIGGLTILAALVAVPLGIERHVKNERARREVEEMRAILRDLDAAVAWNVAAVQVGATVPTLTGETVPDFKHEGPGLAQDEPTAPPDLPAPA